MLIFNSEFVHTWLIGISIDLAPNLGHIQYFLVSRRFMLIVGTLYAAYQRGLLVYTDKKEKQIFLIYKEIKRDRVQSHMYVINGLLIYGKKFAHFLIY
jgi:hypothetical protein